MIFFKYFLFYITTNNWLRCVISQKINDVKNNNDISNSSDTRIKRKIRGDTPNKWSLLISYYVDENVDPNLIRESLNQLQLETCLRFRELKRMIPNVSGIRYIYGNGCFSRVGKADGVQWQRISIGDNCDNIGRVQHETFHALGIDHEHNRIDRNHYLYILEKNINDICKRNFFIVSPLNGNTLNIPYDYGSIMHYDIRAFGKNKEITMLPKDELYKKTIGHINDLSFNDIKTLNLYYCTKRCSKRIKCYNRGYQNPNMCNTCKCVEGFTGKNCKLLSISPPSCGKTFFYAEKFTQQIKAEGKNYCIYHIKAKNRRKIGIKIDFVDMRPHTRRICRFKNSLEIKYWDDKTVTGARFCGLISKTIFLSKSDYVIIYYRSTIRKNKFQLKFKKM
uniref:Zinc metalloproteinase n=1 Tax=Strongyloides stercoralis TaxID=6248 RepID=A0A0K0EJM9_STRER